MTSSPPPCPRFRSGKDKCSSGADLITSLQVECKMLLHSALTHSLSTQAHSYHLEFEPKNSKGKNMLRHLNCHRHLHVSGSYSLKGLRVTLYTGLEKQTVYRHQPRVNQLLASAFLDNLLPQNHMLDPPSPLAPVLIVVIFADIYHLKLFYTLIRLYFQHIEFQ